MEENTCLKRVLETGIALSKEKDSNKILDGILDASMEIAHCDAGTLYINKDGYLHFKVMKTLSMGIDKGKNGEKIDLPPVPIEPDSLFSYIVGQKKALNIDDVYESPEFNFPEPSKYDGIIGFRTKSLLSIPLINGTGEVVGVMQLINALDEEGKVCKFTLENEQIILALASQAAIAMTNMRYLEEMKLQMWSFTEAMAEAIDTRTPYNANHVRQVAVYAAKLADYINELHDKGLEEEHFSKERKEELVLSALLHDLGKLSIPTRIMNKSTRLAGKLKDIQTRFEILKLKYKVMYLEHRATESEYAEFNEKIDKIRRLAEVVDGLGALDAEKERELKSAFEFEPIIDGKRYVLFTDEEKESLLIEKGTLTEKERLIMESHVEMTERILNKVHFNSVYKDVPIWAVEHHEYLNGTGYPKHLTADELSIEARILTVSDICDALLATDRPYKKPLPKDEAFAIMEEMAASGKIDAKLVSYLKACI